VKIACKEGALKGDNIYTKILIRKFIWLVYVFKNNVLVFIRKLANQRRQRLTIHRLYSHIHVRKSRKEYYCAPLVKASSSKLKLVKSTFQTKALRQLVLTLDQGHLLETLSFCLFFLGSKIRTQAQQVQIRGSIMVTRFWRISEGGGSYRSVMENL
jgi:hypothetical protein